MKEARQARISLAMTAGEEHRVLTVEGGRGLYRRTPCPGCPWRRSNAGAFPAEAFAHSADTAYDGAFHTFGCHESGADRPALCAGFILRGADHNIGARHMISRGRLDAGQVGDGGADLFGSYREMAVANGLRPDDPRLIPCRDPGY